jgi:hypothetical protein
MMAARRLNGRQTGYVLAGSMGLSIAMAFAFFVFAMPSALFESIVIGSGLPTFIAAAEPPLGETARLAVAGVVGLLAGVTVVTLFLLGGRQEDRRRAAAKRPISAHEDFSAFEAANFSLSQAQPLSVPAAAFEPTPDPVAQTVPADVAGDVEEPESESVSDGPIFVDFRAFRDTPRPAPEEPLELGQWQVVETPKVEPAAAAPEPFKTAPPTLKAAPISPPTPVRQEEQDESIAALMQRLEAGLDRGVEQGTGASVPPPVPSSPAGLRSTLDELRKMAVRR